MLITFSFDYLFLFLLCYQCCANFYANKINSNVASQLILNKNKNI